MLTDVGAEFETANVLPPAVRPRRARLTELLPWLYPAAVEVHRLRRHLK